MRLDRTVVRDLDRIESSIAPDPSSALSPVIKSPHETVEARIGTQ